MPAGNLKGALVDKYAQIALYDAAENQRVILEAQQAEVRKKAEMKAALDLQIRLQHEAAVREKEEDREWVQREQERIAIWNKEEEVKIEATKAKEMNIRKQREQQLRGAFLRSNSWAPHLHLTRCVCCRAGCAARARALRDGGVRD